MIIQFVPNIPPTIDGVGDFSVLLANQLSQEYSISVGFIVANSVTESTTIAKHYKVFRLKSRDTRQLLHLLRQLPKDDYAIVLHYVGYGYSKRGCPFWLLAALKKWKRDSDSRRLITIFHELNATGSIWTTAYWLSGVQKYIIKRIIIISDFVITTLENNALKIEKMASPNSVIQTVMPILSNIGEPTNIPGLSTRTPRLVVFGTQGRRIEVYKHAKKYLLRIMQELEIKEIVDIGSYSDLIVAETKNLPILMTGTLQASEISKIMLDSVAGIIHYPATILAKSGIFAAYCSHGLLPVVIGTKFTSKISDGLIPTEHYWMPEHSYERLDMALAQRIAVNAHAWYQSHNLQSFAKVLAGYISSPIDS